MTINSWTLCLTAMALICLSACNPPPKSEKPTVPAAASSSASSLADNTSSAPSDAGEPDDEDSRPESEEALLTEDLEALIAPPPTDGYNAIAYEADSTTARAFTGNIKLIPVAHKESDGTTTSPLILESDLGLKYKLTLVPDGGVAAMDVIDWKNELNSSVNMKDYIRRKSDTLDNLVFVYRVVEQTIPKKAPNGDLCGPKTGYIAVSVPFPGALKHEYDGLLSIAAFKPGPWPPKDSSTLCGTFNYSRLN